MHPPFKGTLTGHGKTRLGKYDFRPRLAETKRKNKFSRHLAGKICLGSSQFWLDKFGQISTKNFKMICNRGSYFISKLSNLVQKSTAPAASSHSLTAMPAAHQQIKTNTNKKTKRQTQRQIQREIHTQIQKYQIRNHRKIRMQKVKCSSSASQLFGGQSCLRDQDCIAISVRVWVRMPTCICITKYANIDA